MGPEIIAIAAIAVVVGATLQRLSGMGVGLVVAPTLALLLGPQLGVYVTNATTVCSGFLIMLTVLREVDWKRWAIFAGVGLVGSIPGALLVRALPSGWLSVVIGAVVLGALLLTFTSPRVPHVTGRGVPPLSTAAGVLGGFLNTAAGVAGPVMVIYGRFVRWPQRDFAATMQPTFAFFGLASVATKTATGAVGVDMLPPLSLFAALVVAVVVGIWLGTVLSRRVTSEGARRLAVILAGAGALSALGRGVFEVLS
jgi:uncharacterized membrane protein YfcA